MTNDALTVDRDTVWQALGGVNDPPCPPPLPPAGVIPRVPDGRGEDGQLPAPIQPLVVPKPHVFPRGPGVSDIACQADGLPVEYGGRAHVGQRGFEFFYREKC